VAMISDKPYFLPPNFCKEDDFFCALPRDSNPSELDPCLLRLFPTEQIIASACEPQCARSTTPVVIQSGESKFWVVTDDQFPMEIRCPSQGPIALTDITAGADLVTLPCACEITYGSMTLVSTKIICDPFDTAELTIFRTVPVQWTKRAAPRFSVLGSTSVIPVMESEITIHEERDVTLTEDNIGKYVVETVAAVLGAIVGSFLAALAALCKKCVTAARHRRDPERRRHSAKQDAGNAESEGTRLELPPRRYLDRATDMGQPLRPPPRVPTARSYKSASRSSLDLRWEDLP